MNRKKQQADMVFALGQFFGPVLKIAENPAGFDADEKTRIFARFYHDRDAMDDMMATFCTSEPGHRYSIQLAQVRGAINTIHTEAAILNVPEAHLLAKVKETAAELTDVVMSIPVPIDSAIYEARTPFSTYCFVNDLCSTVKTKIVWLDCYFDQTIFHRFFTDTPKTAQITLVTLPASSAKSAGDKQRVAEFMDVSRLFAAERGPQGYRLIENPAFHDRWLQCDQKLFTLGGSIKDLSKPFTISKLDSTPDNLKHFDDVVQNGAEVFGPNQANHP